MADTRKYVQAQTFTLAGSGVSQGDSSMTLNDFTQIDGTALTMTDFGTLGFGTLEPGSGVNEEQISFTGVTANGDGTYTLTGIKTVLNVSPYTQTSNFAQGHAGGVSFVISNTAGFYDGFTNKGNDETITGTWLVPDPTVATQIANKEYVDNIVITGAPAASTTVPGISIEATQAQVQAKTASTTYLGNPYELFVNPARMSATLYNDYKADTGAVNAYVITPNPAIVAYVVGQQFTFSVSATNTTAATLNVNGLGAKSIVKNVATPLTGGELLLGALYTVTYDGTNLQITSSSTPGALASPYTVNADEFLGKYVTTYIPAPQITTGAVRWTIGSGTPNVSAHSGYTSCTASSWTATTGIPGYSSTQVSRVFSNTKTIRVKCAAVSSTGAGDGLAWGISDGVVAVDKTTNTAKSIKFFIDDSTASCYAVVTNGAAVFASAALTVTTTVLNLYEILYDPVAINAKFYINGALATTISNSDITFPTTGDSLLAASATTDAASLRMISDFTISQQI